MTPIHRLAETDPDLRSLIASIGAPIVDARGLSSSVDQRAFRLTTDSGQRLKLRILRVQDHADTEAYVLAAFAGARFPRLLGQAGRWLLESWIDGVPASEGARDEALIRRCAALQSRLHVLPPPAGSSSPLRTTRERIKALDRRLQQLSDQQHLAPSMAARALRLAERHIPRSAMTGLGHGDLCPENVVVAADGTPFAVDNETVGVMALDRDLARTWYRWPMPAPLWRAYLDEYAAFRDPAPLLAHFPYWAVTVLAESAVVRMQRAGWSPEAALDGLHRVVRAAEDGCPPERLAFA